MSLHETFTSNQALAELLGPARPDLGIGGTWFGSVSIWSGPVIGFSSAGNPVVEVAVSGIPGVTAVQAEVFGTRTLDGPLPFGLASVMVNSIEWTVPGSSTVLARYTFSTPIPFPLSIARFNSPPSLQFVDILFETINTFGGTAQTLFDDYFNGMDALVGGDASDTMYGGNSDDQLDGGAGNDSLRGDAGNDMFLFRRNDAASGDRIDGGSDTDTLRVVGGFVDGINTGSGVDISAITITSIERVEVNGTEAVINFGHLLPGGFNEFVGRTGFVDQLTIRNVTSLNLSFLILNNWEIATDRLAVLGTSAADSVAGSIFTDMFVGYGGQDSFNGGAGDDRMILLEGDFAPTDDFRGGTGNDALQVESTAITSLTVNPDTDLRGMVLDSVEVLDIVRGAIQVDGADFVGSISGTTASPITATVGFNTVIGNDSAGTDTPIVLQIDAGSLLGVDLRGVTFQDWNDGFTNNNLIRIIAGAQTQVIYGTNEYSRIVGTLSTTGVYVIAGTDVDEVFGSYVADYLISGDGDDLVYGLSGNDIIDAGAGNDLSYGDFGNDTMGGAAGNDTLYGGDNDDLLVGADNDDVLEGGEGVDILFGGAGLDVLNGGGSAFDIASYSTSSAGVTVSLNAPVGNTGEAAGDSFIGIEGLQGSNHNDLLQGNDFDNALYGMTGADVIFGMAGNDVIYGHGGNDTLEGDQGADRLDGDTGDDIASYRYAIGPVVADLANAAANTGYAAGDTYFFIEGLHGTVNSDTLAGDAAANRILGDSGHDNIVGRDGNDFLAGGGENDFVYGGLNNDSLYGDAGADNLWGGTGADAHIGGDDAGVDYARYDDANHGNLMIRLDGVANTGAAAVGDTYSGIEGLVGGAGNDTVVGNGLANFLFGSGGVDLVYGGAGNDFLSGDAGGDNLWGGTGADQHIGGTDAGTDYARYDDANYGNLVISLATPSSNTGAAAGDTYSGIEGLVGGAGNDTVSGDGLANFLFGSGGNDLVYGGAGNDYLSGDAGADNLWGGVGADQHIGGTDAGVDYARYDDANYGNLTISLLTPSSNTGAAAGDTYSGIEGLVGGAGNDVVVGNSLANFLFGSGGNDFIDGREGNDYLNGGAGADDFRFATALGATNVDTIADFAAGVDDILLAQAIFSAIGVTLDATEFRIGMALDNNDFLLYNPGTGQLFYDTNANGAGGMIHFASVTINTALTVGDFVMV